MEHLKDFSRSLTGLRMEVASASTNRASAPAARDISAPHPETPPSVNREAFVPPPAPYSGDLGSCQAFLTQCSLVFKQQPWTYASERSRIAFLIGCLRGQALHWASAVWERQERVCFSYSAFIAEMKMVFDHPVRGGDAAKRLFSLHQGNRSVAEFAIEFRSLAVESGWNKEALHGPFLNALSEELKDEMAAREPPLSI